MQTIAIPIIAHYLGIHKATAERMAAAGKFGHLMRKPGGHRYRQVSFVNFDALYGPIDLERLARAEEAHRLSLSANRPAPMIEY